MTVGGFHPSGCRGSLGTRTFGSSGLKRFVFTSCPARRGVIKGSRFLMRITHAMYGAGRIGEIVIVPGSRSKSTCSRLESVLEGIRSSSGHVALFTVRPVPKKGFHRRVLKCSLVGTLKVSTGRVGWALGWWAWWWGAELWVDEMLVVNTNNITAITTFGVIRGRSIFARFVVTDHHGRGYSGLIGSVRTGNCGVSVRATRISTSSIRRLGTLFGDCGPRLIVGLTLPCRSLAVVSTYLTYNYGCVSATGCRPGSRTRFRCS